MNYVANTNYELLYVLVGRVNIMRYAITMVLIIMMMPLSGIVSAENKAVDKYSLQTDSILESYSMPVKIAFDRVSNLESYTTEELHRSREWLVVTSIPISEHAMTHSKPISSKETGILLSLIHI